jgi:hypothetical protein
MAITSLSTSTLTENVAKRNNLESTFMGSVTFVNSGKVTTYAGTAAPSGVQEGDYVFVVSYADSAEPALPTGFTKVLGAFANTVGYLLAYRIWQSSDSNVVVSGMSTSSSVYGMYVYRNVGSIKSGSPSPTYTATNATSVTYPAITTSEANSMVLREAVIDDYSVFSLSHPSGWSAGGTITNNSPGNTSSGSGTVSLIHRQFDSATSVATATSTFGPPVSGVGDNYGLSVILIPGVD